MSNLTAICATETPASSLAMAHELAGRWHFGGARLCSDLGDERLSIMTVSDWYDTGIE
jgi:hypothetical protein